MLDQKPEVMYVQLKNLSTKSFIKKTKHFLDSQFKTIEIQRDLFECIYIHLKISASDSFEETPNSSSDDSYSEDSEVTRDERRQVRYSELTNDKKRKNFFSQIIKICCFRVIEH